MARAKSKGRVAQPVIATPTKTKGPVPNYKKNHTPEEIFKQDMKKVDRLWRKWPLSIWKKPLFREEGLEYFFRK